MAAPRSSTRPPRLDVRLSAEVILDGRAVTGTTRNLSTGGVCIELDRPVVEGSLLGMRLFFVEDGVETENSQTLELNGTVQWVAEADRGFAVGFRFASLTALQLQGLSQTLQALGE